MTKKILLAFVVCFFLVHNAWALPIVGDLDVEGTITSANAVITTNDNYVYIVDSEGSYTTLTAALTAAGGTNPATIRLMNSTSSGTTYTTNTDEVTDNITLVFDRGAVVSVNSGQTLTINGEIQAGKTEQIFGGEGSVAINGQNVWAGWFAGGDLGAKINAANSAIYQGGAGSGGTIYVSNGSYTVTTKVILNGGVSLVSESGYAYSADFSSSKASPCQLVWDSSSGSPFIELEFSSSETSGNLVKGFGFSVLGKTTSDINYTGNGTAIEIADAVRGCTIQYNRFNFFEYGIATQGDTGAQACTIANNWFRGNNCAIALDGGDHSVIRDNRIISCRTYIAQFGCNVNGGDNTAIYSVWFSNNNTAQANANDSNGIKIGWASTVNIISNHFEANAASGGSRCIITDVPEDKSITNLNIMANRFNYKTQAYCIELSGDYIAGLNINSNTFEHDATSTSAVYNNMTSLYNGVIFGNLLFGPGNTDLIDDTTGFVYIMDGADDSSDGVSLFKLDVRTAAPDALGNGQFVYADGSTWNPGDGEGFYGYWAGDWNYLGGSGSGGSYISDTGDTATGNYTFSSGYVQVDYLKLDGYTIQDQSTNGVRLFNSTGGGVTVEHSTGDVGINQTTPSYKLDVNGTGRFVSQLNADTSVVTPLVKAASSAGLYLYEDGNAGIFIEDGGNIGMGVANPAHKVDIAGTASTSVYSLNVLSSGTLNSGVVFRAGVTSKSNGFTVGQDAFGNMLYTMDDTSGRLDVKGNVDIGGDLSITGTCTGCSDFVFDSSYKLPTLEEVEGSINTQGYLPGMTQGVGCSVDDVKPISVTKALRELLIKTEEQQLYILQLNKRVKELEGGK